MLEFVVLLGVPIAVTAAVVGVLLRKLKDGADILMKNGRISSGYYL